MKKNALSRGARRTSTGAPRSASGVRRVGDIDEFELIERLIRGLPKGSTRRRHAPKIGIGDDAALVPTAPYTLITTDTLEEGVHFRADWSVPEEAGWRAMAVNLSDIAAMGGRPEWAVVSLLLPADLSVSAAEHLYRGVASAARTFGVGVVGGNVSRSGGRGVSISVTLLGTPAGKRPLTRGGGRPGDILVVTGYPGLAASGRLLLENAGTSDDLWRGGKTPSGRAPRAGRPEYVLADPAARAALQRFLRPKPRVAAGLWAAGAGGARAAIDLSDGLAADLGHMMHASGCGARLERGLLPRRPGFNDLASTLMTWPEVLMLSGGDDYELLLAIPPARWRAGEKGAARAAGVRLTAIGRLTREAGALVLVDGSREVVVVGKGWRHFGG